MITTLTLNAAIDQVYELDSLMIGQTNRILQKSQQGGGKGVNVARVIASLGGEVNIGGFVGGLNGSKIVELLQEENLQTEFIQIKEENRVCLTIINQQTKEMSELLEAGPTIHEQEWINMLKWIETKAEHASYFVLSGSLPQGIQKTAYATIIHLLKEKGIKVALDTSGDALKKGITAIPFIIKPNEDEITQLIGRPALTHEDLVQAGIKFQKLGIEHVCFSLGEQGALFVHPSGVYKVNAPRINVVNTVGSGDAFLGGLIYKLSHGADHTEAYKWAVACGSANAAHKEIAKVQRNTVEKLLEEIQITKINEK
ncbi:1-phosphofructokinase [Lysinibacillus fusiformis]|uniref:Tagatose-6-phosphate kinase n=1 Tax=Lysinibacillus fusiformis TaxID=28031 RepID=A0A1E4R3F1_9BACI|nr:1-phosphofructokinase [Lysinibacillus fusiformis]ODV54948.1 1-phosphofructokinase [Lysinibacillus fusiformis]HBJ00532.1 1-phosphofructokinase [Lysinibacillus sp.]